MGAAADDAAAATPLRHDGGSGIAAEAQKQVDEVAEKVGLKESRDWNTKNLARRLGVDAMCAATAGGLVAPIITIVDKYVFLAV